MTSKRPRKETGSEHSGSESDELEQKPPIKKTKQQSEKRLIVILENASLETVKNQKKFELLNCDKHKHIISKKGKDPADYRPDIVHNCLLMLFDSPLNKANLLQVYVNTKKNVLIEINPQTRLPRTFERFSGLMVHLLQKMSVKGAGSEGTVNEKLIKVIKGPVTDHLPDDCKIIKATYKSDNLVKCKNLVPCDLPVAIVVGKVTESYAEETVSISQYPLSAAKTCSKICNTFEDMWEIH